MNAPAHAHHAPAADDAVRPLLISTILCGLFLALGWGGQQLGLPAWLAIAAYVVSYVAGGYFRLIEGFESLVKEKNLDINFLMILGAGGAAALGKWEEGAILMFLFALSATLEEFAVGRTRQAIRRLMALAPEFALVQRDGTEVQVPVAELAPGDKVVLGPGERIPADGQVMTGHSAVNESALTGEPIPVDKAPGSHVFAGTVNGQGALLITITKPASESTLARIVKVVEEAQAAKAKSQRLIDWIDRYYTLIVICLAGLAWVLPPLLFHAAWSAAFYRAMMLLVVASPCALVISTPAAILSAIARAARAGILFKGGAHLETAATIKVVALDKTGTLTSGHPGVVEILPEAGTTEDDLLRLAAAAESRSEHPLARAVLRSAQENGIEFPLAEAFTAVPGIGAKATVEGAEVWIGSPRVLEHFQITPTERIQSRLDGLFESGLTTMVVVREGILLGILGMADSPRPEAKKALADLRALGVIKIVMLTGDNRRAAQSVAEAVGVDEVYAELLPEEKLRIIERLEATVGPVLMVGDGVNDAPALAKATIGAAMGGVGSDVAMETADLVLMADELERLPDALRLARSARRTVVQNLVFAVGVILVLVTSVLSDALTLPLAVVGHEGSTILVAFNGIRLLIQPIDH
ncbi:MAG TPA: heavy metal translocating P-type ATPase [Symbiobacteriaceae bacterium]|nr:heavy metal translocating P-type ATPase [Symbiobacteriaceae bacterium]